MGNITIAVGMTVKPDRKFPRKVAQRAVKTYSAVRCGMVVTKHAGHGTGDDHEPGDGYVVTSVATGATIHSLGRPLARARALHQELARRFPQLEQYMLDVAARKVETPGANLKSRLPWIAEVGAFLRSFE
jgi:hypothetical protein